jgi:hypothetical protein
LYLARNPASREVWLRRHDDDESKRRVGQEFRISALLQHAATIDPAEGAVAQTLYERTIDYGAHPNEMALMQTLNLDRKPTEVRFTVSYLQGLGLPMQLSLKSAAQIGVCTLALFRLLLPERFAILGIEHDLIIAKQGI